MYRLRHIFRAYWRDQKGAYAVILALMGGFIAMATHVGLTAYKTQNSATTAEQLIDITCQKLAYADPALYPTGEAAAAAAQKALDARLAHGVRERQGAFTVTAEKVDPSFAVPINRDETYADLRRYEFTVSYRGQVSGINKNIAPSTYADVAITKKCRPICQKITNVVYSNATALGHWFDGRTLKLAQYIDESNQTIDSFNDAILPDKIGNPVPDGTRFVLTIVAGQDPDQDQDRNPIRYRKIISLPSQIYIDNDRYRQRGEPSRKATRIVASDDDQIFIQTLNADGSLPGICGSADDEPCVEADCNGAATGTPQVIEPEPIPLNDPPCKFSVQFPVDRPFTSMSNVDFNKTQVQFSYPKDGKEGELTFKLQNGLHMTKKLAPFYAKNLRTGKVRFKNSVYQTITSEMHSVFALTNNRRWIIFTYSNNKYLVHMAGIHWYYFWNGKDRCITQKSPIVFDTDNIGHIQTTFSADSTDDPGPSFDYFGTGESVKVEWPIGRGQAWLVDNRDGRAASDMNGKRFFGDLDGHNDGYEKLREIDTSGTGILTGHDLNGLLLWFDNGNALVEDGELKTLHEVGVTAVDTHAQWVDLPDGRSALRATAVMNGKSIMTEDLFVQISTKAVFAERETKGADESPQP